MASSLTYSQMITYVQSAMLHIREWYYDRYEAQLEFDRHDYGYLPLTTRSAKIGIRNLKSLLVYFRKLDDDVIERIYPMLESCMEILKRLVRHSDYWDAGRDVERLHEAWRELLIIATDGGRNKPCLLLHLEADEVLSIINCVLENTADFFFGVSFEPTDEPTDAFEVLEAFAVQMRFIKHLLQLTMRDRLELQDLLLPHIQPIAIEAASVFTTVCHSGHGYGYPIAIFHFLRWFKELEPKFLALNLMAADPQVCQAYAQALTASRHAPTLPMGDGDGDGDDDDDDDEDDWEEGGILKELLDSLVSLLWNLLRNQSESRAKDQFKVVYERLRFSRAILMKNSMDEDGRGQIRLLMCDAGAFVFLLHQTNPGRFEDLLQRFDVFKAQFELETIHLSSQRDVDQVSTKDSTSINRSDDGNGRDLDITPMSSHQHPQSSHSQVVGFKDDEFQPLLDRLRHGTTNSLRIVPICGMPGLGKTTLALKLYNHPSVMNHFQAHAWCPISQVLDKRKVLVQLLNQILPGDYSKTTEDDLANELRRSLKGRRYLILLDDIWSAGVWEQLKKSFPDDSTCSRIILTSRCLDIVPHAQPEEQPHLLRLRSDSECFEILQTKVFHKETWSTEVSELVMEIAEKCNGLPLTVIIVAGLLATSEQESWKGILAHLSFDSVSGCEESVLELSYRHLPDYLQPCFLYVGAFPEDEEVSVKRLIRLWVAEGFVRKGDQPKRIEDVAREYVEKLIERSLVMAVKCRSVGGVSSFQVHDVVHDFCRKKARQENLFHLLLQSHDQLSDFNEPCNLQRLFIHSSANHFRETRLFCPRAQSVLFFTTEGSEEGCFYNFEEGPFNEDRYYDLEDNVMEKRLLDMSFIIQIFHILKVLDIYQISLMNGIPSDIGLLTQLRYLAIRSFVTVIPSAVGNLSNLETFIVQFCATPFSWVKEVSFPDTFWNLQKLRYLRVRGIRFTLPVENLDNSSSLLELETLDGVCFYSDDGSMEKQMQKFPNVRTLKCTILQRTRGAEKLHNIVIPEFLSQLESLAVRGDGGVKCELSSSAENLTKLKLETVKMSREDIAVIGKLPNLEVLILSGISYSEGILEMEEEEFTKLRILKLFSSAGLKRWTCSDEPECCLEKLVFRNCENLEEIPTSWLGSISTLEEIQVDRCSSTLESEVKNIEEVQKDFGNLVQVHIHPM